MNKSRTFKYVVRHLDGGRLYGLWIRGYTFQWYYYNTVAGEWLPCTAHNLATKNYKLVANNVLIK